MISEWDEDKRIRNLAKHGVDFVDVPAIFAAYTVTFLDDRAHYSEERYITVGLLQGIAIVLAHTETDEVIRLIAARKATRHEEKQYFETIPN